jgi:hypothetical protein
MNAIKSILILSSLFLIIGCKEVCLNEQEKNSLANKLVNSKIYEVLEQKYDGGNNLQYDIQEIDYDCLNTTIKVKARFTFDGQFSGINYWSIGIFSMDMAKKTWVFTEVSTDPLLKTVLKLGEETKREILKKIDEN